MTVPQPAARTGAALSGIVFIVGAWFLFALHDASVKLLVAGLSAWQVLFVRSLVVLPVCLLLKGRRGHAGTLAPPVRRRLVLNAVVYALAWIAYYTAARHLQLAELETIYFASPIIATALAVLLLQERVPRSRWAALALGFVGVSLACGPSSLNRTLPVSLALLAAGLWAYRVVLIRQLSSSVSTAAQMLLNNSVFLVLCGAVAPWWWQLPSGRELMLMALVGIAGCAAQYLLYDGIRRASASVAAPLEYTGLVWSFALGFVIWGDVPAPAVFMGAGLICASGLFIIVVEWRAARTTARRKPATASPGVAADMPIASGHSGS